MAYLRSHSTEVEVLILGPICFPQIAQENLQPHLPAHTQEGVAGK